ncbi:MAG: hypothetical protein JSW73_02465 [Candidatus Woesearchaeota archaeon]|nr:MAG: hypothetical protein JSW73_02465 [Candidatus Woesearchaeota archaeon]
MEKYEEFLKLAQKEITVSDHLLYKTFSLVKDTKFLIAITDHIIKASEYSLLTLLEYERYWKRIGPFPSNFAIQIEIFDENVSKRYKLDPKYTRLFRNLMEMKVYVNDSPIRFKRGEKYILSTADYKMKTLDLEKVKRYFNLIKTFIKDTEEIINSKNENSGDQKETKFRGLFTK